MIKKMLLLSIFLNLIACGGSNESASQNTEKTQDPEESQSIAKPIDIKSTAFSFAALYNNGQVKAWGNQDWGGDASSVSASLTNVIAIYSNHQAFAALKDDGNVVTWGQASEGGDSSRVQSELHSVEDIVPSRRGFAAIRADKSVVTWGAPYYPDFTAPIIENVETLLVSDSDYSAIAEDGYVTIWGGNPVGLNPEPLYEERGVIASNAVHAQSTNIGNFSAVLESGEIVSWGREGNAFYNIQAPSSIQGVTNLRNTGWGIIAQKQDGTIEYWGYGDLGESYSMPPSDLVDVVDITFSDSHAAALSSDGTVSGWTRGFALGGDLHTKMIDVYVEFPGTLANIHAIFSDKKYDSTSSGVIVAIDGNQQGWAWHWASPDPLGEPVTNAVDVSVNQRGVVILKNDKTVQITGQVQLELAPDTLEPVVYPLLENVIALYSTSSAFAAVREDGSIVTFGRFVDDGIVH